MMLERSFAVSFAQAGNARSAASTAAVVSSVDSRGTFASSIPFTGLVTGVAGVPVQAPSMKQRVAQQRRILQPAGERDGLA